MEKVSIIIPVYNGQNFLEKCIHSLLKQSYKEIEIIAINDGSTDKSKQILEKLKETYPKQLKIITQQNMGVSSTRNNGIKESTGAYIMFVDQDDYVDVDYIETFVNAITNTKNDYVIGGYRWVNADGTVKMSRQYENVEWTKFQFVTPWARIFKRAFLTDHHIGFPKIKWGEDNYFGAVAASYAKEVDVIPYIGYNQLYNETSVSNTEYKKIDKSLDPIKLFEQIKKDANPEGINRDSWYYQYYFLKSIVWYILSVGRKQPSKAVYQEYRRLITWLKEQYPKYHKNVHFKSPYGESKKIRYAIKLFTVLDRIHLLRLTLFIYTKL